MPKGLSEKNRRLALFVTAVSLLLLWIFFTFEPMRFGVRDSLIGDHQNLLFERTVVQNDWEFFKRVLSDNRTRIKEPGDYFLFRPGLTGFLAAVDIFFGDNFFVSGAVSFLLHALASVILFLLCRQFCSMGISFAATFLFATHFNTSYMVANRHVAPYIFSLIFYCLGVWLFSRRGSGWKNVVWVSGCFFIASLFHENAALAAGVFGMALFYPVWHSSRRMPSSEESLTFSKVCVLALMPATLCFGWNLIDFLIHSPEMVADSSSEPGLVGRALAVPYLFFFVVGAFAVPFLAPQTITGHREAYKTVVFPLIGVIAVFLLIRWYRRSLRETRVHADAEWITLLGVGSFFLVLCGVLTVGREVLRGFGYVIWAKWYQYFGTFCLVPFGAALAEKFRRRSRKRGATAAYVVLGLMVANMVFYGHFRRKAVWGPGTREDRVLAHTLFAVSRAMPHGYCYAGASDEVSAVIPEVFIYRSRCGVRSGKPLYLHRNGTDGLVLLDEDGVAIRNLRVNSLSFLFRG